MGAHPVAARMVWAAVLRFGLMFPANRAPWSHWLAAGVLIAAFLLQSFFASRIKSPVFDEPAHIAAGLSYLETGELTANPQHPPLLKEASALSLLLAGVRWPESAEARRLIDGSQPRLEWPVGSAIIAANGPDKVMFWSRLPLILPAALLGILLYVWGREMVGPTAALGALFLYAPDPTVLAHSYLVATDAGQWLRRTPPAAIVGHSLYVYDIPQGSAAAPGQAQTHSP